MKIGKKTFDKRLAAARKRIAKRKERARLLKNKRIAKSKRAWHRQHRPPTVPELLKIVRESMKYWD